MYYKWDKYCHKFVKMSVGFLELKNVRMGLTKIRGQGVYFYPDFCLSCEVKAKRNIVIKNLPLPFDKLIAVSPVEPFPEDWDHPTHKRKGPSRSRENGPFSSSLKIVFLLRRLLRFPPLLRLLLESPPRCSLPPRPLILCIWRDRFRRGSTVP